ncbi:MAG: hypothetical protein H0U54_00055 [Acidobacteria bacterium]|nr:hypothetical protein [Acidobacteriota bacterium]
MLKLTMKPYQARFWMMLGVSLMIGVLAIQCQPLKSSSQTANNSTSQIPGNTSNQNKDDPSPDNKLDVSGGRVPIALVYDFDPWGMVLGSDSPSFALYADGLVIFAHRAQDGKQEYASTVLSEQERDALVSSLPVKQFFELEKHYETTMITDQVTTSVSLWDKDQLKSVSVYGGLRRTDNDRKAGAPAAFIEIYEKLKSFQSERAAKWMPEKVEMMIWSYDNAGDAMSWPKNWPDTKHPETKKRGDGRDNIAYSIYLSVAQYETLRKRVERDSERAVLINGRKWAFSFRFPFPNEDYWRKK